MKRRAVKYLPHPKQRVCRVAWHGGAAPEMLAPAPGPAHIKPLHRGAERRQAIEKTAIGMRDAR